MMDYLENNLITEEHHRNQNGWFAKVKECVRMAR